MPKTTTTKRSSGIAVDAEGAHQDEDEHDRNHERVAHLGQLGELSGQDETDQGADDSRNPLKPDDAVDELRVLFHHLRTRQVSPGEQRDDKQRGHDALGKSQQQCGDEIAAVFGVVGALRRDDAAHVALAEVLRPPLQLCAAWP